MSGGKNQKLKDYCYGMAAVLMVLLSCICVDSTVCAKSDECEITSVSYSFGEKSEYEIEDTEPSILEEQCNVGKLTISGSLSGEQDIEGIKKYFVNEGNVTFSLVVDNELFERDSMQWKLAEDKKKIVNGIELEKSIQSGALIVQTSLDGERWVTDISITDIIKKENGLGMDIYETSEIQIQNGCYYRIIVAYQMERKVSEGKILFVNNDKYETVKIANVYTVYLETKEEKISSDATPRKELGSVVNAGEDEGFVKENMIEKNDPHYGWKLGQFFVNGYTREVVDDDGTSVFLKNAGDKVTLWFNLNQDIDSLDGNEDYKIHSNAKGYDQYFQTDTINMKKGTLFIRYTDEQGVVHEPIKYTNYLAANATTRADTRVQLFEEGDYEVALDYSIIDKKPLVDKVSDYRIFFKFKIRNGNCMFFPFDVITNQELRDGSCTPNGFKIDMAKSRYLTIDVKKSVLIQNEDGTVSEDVRYNRPAKDTDSYTEDGIYTFNVKNLYTDENTTKVFYVGDNKVLKALSTYIISIDELNGRLSNGATLKDDGTLANPIEETTTEEITEEVTTEEVIEEVEVVVTTEAITEDVKEQNEEDEKAPTVPIVVFCVLLIVVMGIVMKSKRKVTEIEPDPEEERE